MSDQRGPRASVLTRRALLQRTGMAALAVVGTQIAAACATPTTGGPSAAPKATPAQVRGGHITEGQIIGVVDLNPLKVGYGDKIHNLLYLSPYVLLPNGTLAPRLARSAPKISADGTTYTIELRNDVKWSDGSPTTAEDVAFTYKLLYHPDYKPFTSPFRADLEKTIAEVEATDQYTVVIKTKAPNSSFLPTHLQYGVLPKSVLGSVAAAALNQHDFNRAPAVVNGPYRFLEWKADDHITVVRNDGYSGTAAYVDRFIVKLGDQNSFLEQLKTGEIDLFRANTFSRFEEIQSQPNLETHSFPTGTGPRFWYNLDPAARASKIFQSKAVRQALRYGADLQGYLSAVLYKAGKLPSGVGVFPPYSWANNPTPKVAYTYERAKAEQLLDEDGWKKGTGGIRAKDGVPLKFELMTSADSQEWQAGAAIILQNWKDLGADVQIKAPRFAQLTTSALGREFDVLMNSSPYATAVDPEPSQAFHSRNAAKGGRNYGAYKNPQVDQLIDQASTTIDQGRRKELYFQLQDILNDEIPSWQSPFPNSLWAYNKRVRGVGGDVVGSFNGISRWFLEQAWVTDGK